MGNMYDRLFVEVRVDCSRRESVSESDIRIAEKTQLYGQLIAYSLRMKKIVITYK